MQHLVRLGPAREVAPIKRIGEIHCRGIALREQTRLVDVPRSERHSTSHSVVVTVVRSVVVTVVVVAAAARFVSARLIVARGGAFHALH